MHRINVESSNLKSMGYDQGSMLLEIEFNDGCIYHYYNLPLDVYQGLMSAPSHGKYFNQHIMGRYRYDRICLSATSTRQSH